LELAFLIADLLQKRREGGNILAKAS